MKHATETIRLLTAILLGLAAGLDVATKVRTLMREEATTLTDEETERIKRVQQAMHGGRSSRT